jgi:hypothetical protein
VRHEDCHFKFQHQNLDGKVMRGQSENYLSLSVIVWILFNYKLIIQLRIVSILGERVF